LKNQRLSWLIQTLQHYPEIAIFLTLAVGFFVGSLKIGSFSLGNVAGVLLAGVLIGQLHITISPNVKAVLHELSRAGRCHGFDQSTRYQSRREKGDDRLHTCGEGANVLSQVVVENPTDTQWRHSRRSA
jgi:Predicted Permease Membrane Region